MELSRLGLSANFNEAFDILPLARERLPDLSSWKLGGILSALGLTIRGNLHRARNDVEATIEIAKKLLNKFEYLNAVRFQPTKDYLVFATQAAMKRSHEVEIRYVFENHQSKIYVLRPFDINQHMLRAFDTAAGKMKNFKVSNILSLRETKRSYPKLDSSLVDQAEY